MKLPWARLAGKAARENSMLDEPGNQSAVCACHPLQGIRGGACGSEARLRTLVAEL
ncbi:MAG TPA: hypothetical protein VGO93_25290 [Candidatus Xenobia bacterium]